MVLRLLWGQGKLGNSLLLSFLNLLYVARMEERKPLCKKKKKKKATLQVGNNGNGISASEEAEVITTCFQG